VAAGLFALSTSLRYIPQDSLLSAWVELPESLFFGWLLFRLLDPGSWPSKILSHPMAVGVGQLSYGLFLFHTLVGMVVSSSLTQAGVEMPKPVLVAGLILITTGLAAASYYTIERPILQWSKNVILPDPAPLIDSFRLLLRRVFFDSSSGR
jgi:peptidoglycan/LPS O-acetylase OafA/YrhL